MRAEAMGRAEILFPVSKTVPLRATGERGLPLTVVSGSVTLCTARERDTSIFVMTEHGEREISVPGYLNARAGHRVSAVYSEPAEGGRQLVYAVNHATGSEYLAAAEDDPEALAIIAGPGVVGRILAPYRRWRTLVWTVIGPGIGGLAGLIGWASSHTSKGPLGYVIACGLIGSVIGAWLFRHNIPAIVTGARITRGLADLHRDIFTAAREQAATAGRTEA
jgi:uncharacterized membrane protein YeaQ/YmgE (transglycosylase-associated protein family)